MSEKIYALLLGLFPSRFREAYREEALQLFRDRAHDEKGFLPRIRLWLDLFADLATSVPREYFYAEPELLGASSQRLGGAPSFYFLGDESPRPGALFLGTVLSLVALLTFSRLLGQGGNHQPRIATTRQLQPAADPRSSASTRRVQHPASDADSPGGGESETVASTSGQSAGTANPFSAAPVKPVDSQSTALPPQGPSRSSEASSPYLGRTANATQAVQNDANAMIRIAVQRESLDAAERQRVVDSLIANLRQHYVYRDVAQKMADVLRTHEKRGDDDAITNGDAFADLLTKQMRDVSHDMHLELVYSSSPLPPQPAEPTPAGLARYRAALQQENCTFEKVEILPRNIGYLKLNSFPDLSVCRPTATAAMASLNHVEAMIFDLRDNRGGMPETVALMAAYLFDHPEYLYNPRENTTEHSWTLSPIPGNQLADKPVYVLTSARTFSGAEQFCYDLKMLKRITLVGETTGGAAHSGVWYRIDDHFGIGIPETKPINPFSKADWAAVGVEPDVKVKAADALNTAVKLAESKLQKK
jgi:hypothetical protein